MTPAARARVLEAEIGVALREAVALLDVIGPGGLREQLELTFHEIRILSELLEMEEYARASLVLVQRRIRAIRYTLNHHGPDADTLQWEDETPPERSSAAGVPTITSGHRVR